MLRRIPSIILALTLLLSSTLFVPNLAAYALTATLRPITRTPTVTKTITPSPTTACTVPTYYVTVTPSASTVQIGDQITVSATSNVGIANFTLRIIDNATGTDQAATNPLFTPTSNPTMTAPAQWTLTAVRAGSASFRVSASGEVQFCSGGNIGWTYGGASGTSGNVTINPTPTVTATMPAGTLPDLTVLSITEYSYTPPTPTPNSQGCWSATYSTLGLRVTIQNIGAVNAGSFVLDLNGAKQTINGLAAGQSLAVDFKVALTRSRIATVDATGLIAESNEANNTYSLTLSAATSTRTGTPRPTLCITRTPTATPTITMTPTITPTSPMTGGACSPVNAVITAPFTRDGAGTFCWQSSNLGGYVNSWNMSALTINNVNFTNLWMPSSSYPAKINGYWYVVYAGMYPWSHFEAK